MRIKIFNAWLIAGIFLFGLCLFSIWYDYFEYYSVDSYRSVKAEEIAELRITPDDDQFDKILEIDSWSPSIEKSALASKDRINELLKSGRMRFYGGEIKVLPFARDHLIAGNTSDQLAIHGLMIVKALTYHYSVTKRSKYIEVAQSYLLDYIKHEKATKFDHGFLYNDHSVASRLYVVSYFWRYYRNSEHFNKEIAQVVIEYAGSLSNRLLKKSFYTYRTNHGLMQNVALVLVSTVFEPLKESKKWRETGLNRLDEQFQYLVSQEGFFLEHSFEYHDFFISLSDAILAYSNVGKFSLNKQILDAVQKGKDLAKEVRRPDGTLPPIGDTSFILKNNSGEEKSIGSQGLKVYSDSGFALSINNPSSNYCSDGKTQNTLFWQNITGHGHKHWDDMTIDIWDCSEQWWRASGYVPYWHRFRDSSEKWYGSNAPHLNNEILSRLDNAKVKEYVNSSNLQYLSLVRKVNDQAYINREYVKIGYLTIIYDYLQSKVGGGKLITYWTMSHNKNLSRLNQNMTYSFVTQGKDKQLFGKIIGDEEHYKVDIIEKDELSILGWVEVESKLQPTVTFRAESIGTNPYFLNAFIVKNTDIVECAPEFKMERKTDISDYNFTVRGCGIDVEIKKKSNAFYLNYDGKRSIQNISIFTDNISSNKRPTVADYAAEYGRKFRPLKNYRERMSYLVGILFMIYIPVYLVQYKLLSIRYRFISNLSMLFGWIGLNYWIGFVYFN